MTIKTWLTHDCRAWLGLSALLLLLFLPREGYAQRIGGQRFIPAASEDAIFETEGADRRALYLPYVALWTHYALAPVTLIDSDGNQVGVPIQHLLAADLVATVTVWRGLELGLGLPLTLYSWGDDAAAQTAGLSAAPGFAVGDLTLRIGYRFRLADRTALAVQVPVLLPTSGDENPLTLGVGARPTISVLQGLGPVELLFNLFFLFRGEEQVLDYHGFHEMGARLGARVKVGRNWWTALLFEIGFTTSLVDIFSPANTPAEIRAGAEHWFNRHWRLIGFVGTGISPSVGSPDFRMGIAIAFGDNQSYRPRPYPRSGDRDGDTIPDEVDACPHDPEDPDDFEDSDGCPENDNDGDGIADRDDHCPTAPETQNGIADSDGCPDLIRIEATLIATFERVHFRTGSNEILEQSHPMLEEIAATLIVNPDLNIRIEGHTDSQGDDEMNMELSHQRAASVRQFLVDHEVPTSQLDSEGLGETVPLDSNTTNEGRARNRRVEFHIIEEE